MFAETMNWPDKHTEPYHSGIHNGGDGLAPRLAEEYFDAPKVITRVLERVLD